MSKSPKTERIGHVTYVGLAPEIAELLNEQPARKGRISFDWPPRRSRRGPAGHVVRVRPWTPKNRVSRDSWSPPSEGRQAATGFSRDFQPNARLASLPRNFTAQ